MKNAAELAGRLFVPTLVAALLVYILLRFRRRKLSVRRHAQPQAVSDEPEGTPYRIYTKEFDRVVPAREVAALLAEADRGKLPGKRPIVETLDERIAAAEIISEESGASFARVAARLDPFLAAAGSSLAATVLIDQSGSMRDRMIEVASSMRWLSDRFAEHGVPLEIAGFTTLGWHGGKARRTWIEGGRPFRPGRLCVQLYIRYQDFGRPLDPQDWRAMLEPGSLRENVDGEALQWAAGQLEGRSEPRKLLLILSDGAPVDDATLMENGPSYLSRHIRAVIAEIEEKGVVQLGAIGLHHRVDEWYARSKAVENLRDLPQSLADLLIELGSSC